MVGKRERPCNLGDSGVYSRRSYRKLLKMDAGIPWSLVPNTLVLYKYPLNPHNVL